MFIWEGVSSLEILTHLKPEAPQDHKFESAILHTGSIFLSSAYRNEKAHSKFLAALCSCPKPFVCFVIMNSLAREGLSWQDEVKWFSLWAKASAQNSCAVHHHANSTHICLHSRAFWISLITQYHEYLRIIIIQNLQSASVRFLTCTATSNCNYLKATFHRTRFQRRRKVA